MLVPLKITTEYSLLKSTIKIKDLITFLKEHNLSTCSIVDDNLFGVQDFYQNMLKNNLKPIIGFSININNLAIYLYAKNINGYHNLLKIHTLKEFHNLTLDTIKEYLEDIKIIIPFNSKDLLANFSNAYIGYSNKEEKVASLLLTNNVVYLKDVRCLTKEDTIYLKYLEAIDKGVLVKDILSDYSLNYLNLDVYSDDIKTTIDFAKDLNVEFTNKERYIPKYNSDVDSLAYLVSLTHKGLAKRLNNQDNPVYTKRLNYELSVIKNMGFVDYFLIVYDYVLYAKKNNILVGPGRGSAAGSLVSYTLGITNVDPLKYHLLFERFLNPERVSMPDIDIDFEYTKRNQVIDYVKNKYGEDKVALIMAFGTLASKQALRDVARVLDVPLDLTNKFVSLINAKLTLKENYNPSVQNYLDNYSILKNVYKIALKLEGLKRHISTHAAGVVICSVPLDNLIPIINNDNFIMTGFEHQYLEDLGILKMDFLALRNLTIIAQVLDLIKENTNETIDLNAINLNDAEVFKLFCNGDTEGIFQFESSGMRNLMLKLKPTTFSDLVASVALFRPGPMQNIDMFIARKKGMQKITYLDPALEPILKETYGIIIYQEQVMQILQTIGGYSYAEADNIRRAMSKKKEEIIKADKEHFISSALKRGYKEDLATSIYELILKFANYGFNKAHSVSYALIGYQMAYLKANYPLYFITNLLNMSIGIETKTKEYIIEAKNKGIKIIKPDINMSTNAYLIKDNSLVLPLLTIKNLGESSTNLILEERTKNCLFKDYYDFLIRVSKLINKKALTMLIYAGSLDSFNLTKKTMIENLDIALNYASLVHDIDVSLIEKPALEIKGEYSKEELRAQEFSCFGFYLTNHPVAKYQAQNITKLNKLELNFDKRIQTVALIEKIKTIKTKKGDNMAFLTISDEETTSDLVIFPSYYYILANLHIGDIIMIQGKVTKRFDKYQINGDKITKVVGD